MTDAIWVLIALLIALAGVLLWHFNRDEEAEAAAQMTPAPSVAAPYTGKQERNLSLARERLAAAKGLIHFDTIVELDGFVDRNISYRSDDRECESWKDPREFLSDRHGDCEDFALFALAAIDREKNEINLILGRKNGVGHAWVIVRGDYGVYLWDTFGLNVMHPEAWAFLNADDSLYAQGYVAMERYDADLNPISL